MHDGVLPLIDSSHTRGTSHVGSHMVKDMARVGWHQKKSVAAKNVESKKNRQQKK